MPISVSIILIKDKIQINKFKYCICITVYLVKKCMTKSCTTLKTFVNCFHSIRSKVMGIQYLHQCGSPLILNADRILVSRALLLPLVGAVLLTSG